MSHDNVVASSATVEQFLKAIGPKLKRTLATTRVPVEDAEDVLQEALVALVEKWDEIRDRESWLLRTLRNCCFLYWRNQHRQLHSALDATLLECLSRPVAPAQERSDLRSDLRQMIERLPPRCRALLELRFQLGYDAEEIAERLGYRGSSIGKITHRCIEALAREMVGATAPMAAAVAGGPSPHSPPPPVPARRSAPPAPQPARPPRPPGPAHSPASLEPPQRVPRPLRLEPGRELAPATPVFAGADLPEGPPVPAPAEVRQIARRPLGSCGPLVQARWPRGHGGAGGGGGNGGG
jgi:RNA polymerase sigma factor (sigma-70 family)